MAMAAMVAMAAAMAWLVAGLYGHSMPCKKNTVWSDTRCVYECEVAVVCVCGT